MAKLNLLKMNYWGLYTLQKVGVAQNRRGNKEYCHGFFGSTALLCLQESQYEVGCLSPLRSLLVQGLMKPFFQPHLLLLRPLVIDALF